MIKLENTKENRSNQEKNSISKEQNKLTDEIQFTKLKGKKIYEFIKLMRKLSLTSLIHFN